MLNEISILKKVLKTDRPMWKDQIRGFIWISGQQGFFLSRKGYFALVVNALSYFAYFSMFVFSNPPALEICLF